MINISLGTYHYHTLVSAIIITRHIKTDYTQRLASSHPLCQMIITHGYSPKMQKTELICFKDLKVQCLMTK